MATAGQFSPASGCSQRIEAALRQCIGASPGLTSFLAGAGDMGMSSYFASLHRDRHPLSGEAAGAVIEVANLVYPNWNYSVPLPPAGCVSTSFHGGVISEAQSSQSLMLEVLGAAASHAPVLIALQCGVVRLNNETYPRGVWCHRRKLPFFPNDFEQRLTHACEPLSTALVTRFLARARKEGCDVGWLEDPLRETLYELPEAPFVIQASNLNEKLYSRAFQGFANAPRILTLPLEEVTLRYLLRSFERKDLFYRMVFEPDARDLALRTFDGITGAWTDRVRGTQFFTGADKHKDQTALFMDRDRLLGRERTFELALDPYKIEQALIARRIAPGVLLSLLLLRSRGLIFSGGYFQCSYLPRMISAMMRFLGDLGETMSGFGETPTLVSHGMLALSDRQHPASIDSALGRPLHFQRALKAKAEAITVRNGICLNIPQLYRELVARKDQDSELKNLDYPEVFRELGMSDDF